MRGSHPNGFAEGFARALACVALFSAAGFLWPSSARADHSLGRACLTCHALRSTRVVPGSRNILSDNVQDVLYQTDFYCGSSWSGGEPLDCSYCHGSPGDIANEIALATGGTNGSAHPVRVAADSATYPNAKRILCNDCHNGDTDNATHAGPDLTPDTECTKSATDGYPNHHSTVVGTVDPGSNNLADNPPRLTAPYGPLGGLVSSGGGVDWTGGADGMLDASELVCFICHDGKTTTKPPFSTGMNEQTVSPIATTAYPDYGTDVAANIAAEYNLPGGGHNLAARGTLVGKLPCYDCHDPHAASGAGNENEALILNGADTPANPYQTSNFSVTGYIGTNDRVVCFGCHDGSYTVEGVTPPNPTSTTPVFPFHADVHSGIGTSGNCLQPNGGCHQSPHNTNFFRCLDCHSTNVNPNADARLSNPSNGGYVGHVDSEYGHIGYVIDNGLLSFHTIPYAAGTWGGVDPPDPTAVDVDLTVPDNNGCLKCHDTRGGPTNAILKDDSGGFYTGSRTNSLSTRESLKYYDPFCLQCHDGSGTDSEFTVNRGYDLTDPTYGTISFLGGAGGSGGTLQPPRVSNRSGSNWDLGYFYTAGHGRGNGGTGTTGTFPVSGNAQSKIPCLECHLYHGSTAYKLLPGDREASDGVAHVVKGATYGRETVGVKFTIGGVSDSTDIDYADYTDPSENSRIGNVTPVRNDYRSWYVSDYTTASPWSTYYNTGTIQVPTGTTTHFGTTGDVHANSSTLDELNCGQDASSGGAKVGFCNACHLYSNSTDGTTGTYGWVYTHEASVGAVACDSKDLKSQSNMFKDCAECHDPHGSGEGVDSASSPANIYMIRRKIKHARTLNEADVTNTNSWSSVIFEARTGTDSYNDGDNTHDLCAVCHESSTENTDDNVDHNYRSEASTSHNVGADCALQCHSHGSPLTQAAAKASATGNRRFNGFGLGGTCTGCHGLPPISPCDEPLVGNERPENYPGGGGSHRKHVAFLRDKLGIAADGFTDGLCTPCHGPTPGSAAWHNGSNYTIGPFTQAEVDIIDGAGNFGGNSPTYDGAAVLTTSGAKGGEPQACANLNCHGPGATVKNLDVTAATPLTAPLADPGLLMWDQMCYAGADTSAAGRANACAGCHASRGTGAGMPDTRIQVGSYDSDNPNALPQGVAASYFATVSAYGRGGHGDPEIQNEDPPIDSAPGDVTPLVCTACHDDAQAHFPAGANPHRLANQTLENNTHSTTALCNSCHPGSTYPTNHHPSFYGPTGSNATLHDIVPAAGQGVYTAPPGGVSASGSSGNADFFVDFWGGDPGNGNQTTPAPAPDPVMALARYVGGQPTTDQVMCVTCHNPHGTDLFVTDPGGVGGAINDNNMLRLRDEDNTLCNACH